MFFEWQKHSEWGEEIEIQKYIARREYLVSIGEKYIMRKWLNLQLFK